MMLPGTALQYGWGLRSEVKTLGVSCVRGRNEGNVMCDYWVA